MRRLLVVIVVATLGFGWTVPVAAQAQVETPAWGWEALAERLTGWVEGAWNVVAGASIEASPPESGGETELLALDDGEKQATSETPPGNGETYPGLDPDG